jgi:hypothetical protein
LAVDEHSQQIVKLLNELGAAIDALRSFGYGLYLKTRAHSWGNPHSLSLVSNGTKGRVGLGTSVSLDSTRARALVFGTGVKWTPSDWQIQSYVDDEDGDRDLITINLWSSTEYTATTIEDAVHQIQKAIGELIASVNEPRVAASIASIEPRKQK